MLKCGSAAETTPPLELESISWGPSTGSRYQTLDHAAALPTVTLNLGEMAKVVTASPVAASKASRS